ncbi:uncharacterized protein TNCV_2110811 [Trichonephila clavipes]|nr:uncharacterized protein TNCV_2110811 [Trichonephila clavipes]
MTALHTNQASRFAQFSKKSYRGHVESSHEDDYAFSSNDLPIPEWRSYGECGPSTHRKCDVIDQKGQEIMEEETICDKVVRVQYFVRGGFVGHRSRVSSKHLSLSHLPVDGVRFLGGQKGVALQLQDARVGVGSNKDADHS